MIMYIYIWPWVTNNFPSLFRKNIDLGAILDADLDAQRDFAPLCIIQKQSGDIYWVGVYIAYRLRAYSLRACKTESKSLQNDSHQLGKMH